MAREPSISADQLRKLDAARCEELYMNLQPAVRKGNPRAVEACVKVLRHSAQLFGYNMPQRHEVTGRDGKPLTILNLLEAIGPFDDE